MSKQEFTRLDVQLGDQPRCLRVSDDALMGLQRRQVVVCCAASGKTGPRS